MKETADLAHQTAEVIGEVLSPFLDARDPEDAAALGALAMLDIARHRPDFFPKVVRSYGYAPGQGAIVGAFNALFPEEESA